MCVLDTRPPLWVAWPKKARPPMPTRKFVVMHVSGGEGSTPPFPTLNGTWLIHAQRVARKGWLPKRPRADAGPCSLDTNGPRLPQVHRDLEGSARIACLAFLGHRSDLAT